MKKYDVCINGAGPLGMCLALMLDQKNIKTLLIERQEFDHTSPPPADGRAYALNGDIKPLLESLHSWDAIQPAPQPIEKILVLESKLRSLTDTKEGYELKQEFSLDASETNENEPLGWLVEAYSLLAKLRSECINAANIDLFTGAQGNFKRTDETVEIQISSLKDQPLASCTAQLLVAADGRRSSLRENAGIELSKMDYKKHALVTIVSHELPHNGTALEHFLPEGPFALLPLSPTTVEPNRSAIVWTDTPEKIARLAAMDEQTFLTLVKTRLPAPNLGQLTKLHKRWLYPLTSQFAHKYTSKRLALIGDSAHGLHPVAGQGMNAGFEDIKALAKLLENAHAENSDLGSNSLLKDYESLARPRSMGMLFLCDSLERVFSSSNPVLSAIRSAGMKAFSTAPSLRKGLVSRLIGNQ